MPSQNDRFQHLEGQINDLRDRVHEQGQRIAAVEKSNSPAIKEEKSKAKSTDIWLVLFTGLLFIGAMLQWQATRDAIKDTRVSFQIGTRAWVVQKLARIKPVKLDAPEHGILQEGEGIKNSQSPFLIVTLVNSGHSPAIHLTFNESVEVRNEPISDDFVLPAVGKDRLRSDFVLGPDDTTEIGTPYVFKGDEYKQVTTGKTFLTVYGVVNYYDVFGNQHETKYCDFYNWMTEKLSQCPHFNSAT
jgi:hypothetical protein